MKKTALALLCLIAFGAACSILVMLILCPENPITRNLPKASWIDWEKMALMLAYGAIIFFGPNALGLNWEAGKEAASQEGSES